MRSTILTIVLTATLLFVSTSPCDAQDTVIVQTHPAQAHPSPYVAPYGQGYAPGYAPGYVPGYAPCPLPPVHLARERRGGSIFRYGFRGMFSGALAGLGASYFIAADGGDAGTAVGVTIVSGALTGAGLGLTLGILDRAGVESAYYVSRDLTCGVGFGAVLGLLAGSVGALSGGDGESVVIGAAAGSLAGLGLGLIVGVVEGTLRHRRPRPYGAARAAFSVARLTDEPGGWGARLVGVF